MGKSRDAALEFQKIGQSKPERLSNSLKGNEAYAAGFAAFESLDVLDAEVGALRQFLLSKVATPTELFESMGEAGANVSHIVPILA